MTNAVKTDLPLPLPADVDVSDMPHMPLFDERLLKSRAWLRAKNWRGEGPGLGFCLINLFSRAFREVPAGSIEDDDDVLADAACCDIDHWRAMKERALSGWSLIGGRWHHQVVSEIVWDLWLKRLESRHENALKAWRALAKRRHDKGDEPPDPPGGFYEWRAREYPATDAYLLALCPPQTNNLPACGGSHGSSLPPCDSDIGECDSDIGPKRSKGKDISPPVVPPTAQTVDKPAWQGTGANPDAEKTARKRWFGHELSRLDNEFGQMAGVMKSYLQRPGVSGKFGFVETMKGAFLDPRGPAIVMPSKRRADALVAAHGSWIYQHWPGLIVRHAKVDELRAFKARAA